MKRRILDIYEKNIELLGIIEKVVYYFREGSYVEALDEITKTGDGINMMAEAIIQDREYFSLVSTESVAEMLQGILEAKQCRDYVLLADLYEVQLMPFICKIQELIQKKEDDVAFDNEKYKAAIIMMKENFRRSLFLLDKYHDNEDEYERNRVNQSALLEEEFNPNLMLDEGYCVEYTSCGLMTVGVSVRNKRTYLHTNNLIWGEAFLTAKKWHDDNVKEYIIYGLGFGYHIMELIKMDDEAEYTIFEKDMNIIKLFCAFSGQLDLLKNKKVNIIYDPELDLFEDYILKRDKGSKVCIHIPSLRRIEDKERRMIFSEYVPWNMLLEKC